MEHSSCNGSVSGICLLRNVWVYQTKLKEALVFVTFMQQQNSEMNDQSGIILTFYNAEYSIYRSCFYNILNAKNLAPLSISIFFWFKTDNLKF